MRKVIIFIFILTLVHPCTSETNDSVNLLRDSINAIIKNPLIGTENKLRKINDFSYGLINIDPDMALFYVNEAIKINLTEEGKYIPEFANSYNILGIIYKNKGFYELAVSNYLKSMKYAETNNDTIRISVVMNNIGVVFNLNQKDEKALEYFQKSLKIEEKVGNKAQISIRYYNIGESFQKLGNYDSAMLYFSKSLLIEEMENSDIGKAYAHFGIGKLSFDFKKYNNSEHHLNNSLALMDSIQDIELNCKVLLAFADLMSYKKEQQKARNYLEKVIGIAREYDYRDFLIEALEKYKTINEMEGDYKNASIILNELYLLQKEKTEGQVLIKINELQKLYNLEIQQREMDNLKAVDTLLKLEQEQSDRVKNYLLLTILIVFGIFGFNIYSLNKLRNKE